MKTIILLFLLPVLLGHGISLAQPGSLDFSFDPGTGATSTVNSTAIQSDEKILLGGSFTEYNGVSRSCIARLNADGTLDTSFNPGLGANNAVMTIVILDDGKILIGGWFTSYNGTQRNRIARLNADGTLDTSFDPGTGASGDIYSISIQSDGRIIISGNLTFYNGVARSKIARLNADGSLDTSFDPGTGADYTIKQTVIQSDGKIIIGGSFDYYDGMIRNRIARLNTDGSLDTTFDPGTGANSHVDAVVIQDDGKIIVSGSFTTFNDEVMNRITRLNMDGSLDGTFDSGTGTNSFIYASILQSDGKIIIGGNFTEYNGTSRSKISRLNTDGSLDTSFDPGTGANNIITTISIQSDGKIIIGGFFTNYNGTGRERVARLNNSTVGLSEMSVDKTFILYPNPAKQYVNIELSEVKGVESIILYNLMGKIIRTYLVSETVLDLTGISTGSYLLTVVTKNGILQKQVVVE